MRLKKLTSWSGSRGAKERQRQAEKEKEREKMLLASGSTNGNTNTNTNSDAAIQISPNKKIGTSGSPIRTLRLSPRFGSGRGIIGSTSSHQKERKKAIPQSNALASSATTTATPPTNPGILPKQEDDRPCLLFEDLEDDEDENNHNNNNNNNNNESKIESGQAAHRKNLVNNLNLTVQTQTPTEAEQHRPTNTNMDLNMDLNMNMNMNSTNRTTVKPNPNANSNLPTAAAAAAAVTVAASRHLFLPPPEIMIDHLAVPPSPMREPQFNIMSSPSMNKRLLDDYSPGMYLNFNDQEEPCLGDPVGDIAMQRQLMDAQRLVRIVLGKPLRGGGEEYLAPNSILQAIRSYALMKAELIDLRKKQEIADGDPPAILQALGSPAATTPSKTVADGTHSDGVGVGVGVGHVPPTTTMTASAVDLNAEEAREMVQRLQDQLKTANETIAELQQKLQLQLQLQTQTQKAGEQPVSTTTTKNAGPEDPSMRSQDDRIQTAQARRNVVALSPRRFFPNEVCQTPTRRLPLSEQNQEAAIQSPPQETKDKPNEETDNYEMPDNLRIEPDQTTPATPPDDGSNVVDAESAKREEETRRQIEQNPLTAMNEESLEDAMEPNGKEEIEREMAQNSLTVTDDEHNKLVEAETERERDGEGIEQSREEEAQAVDNSIDQVSCATQSEEVRIAAATMTINKADSQETREQRSMEQQQQPRQEKSANEPQHDIKVDDRDDENLNQNERDPNHPAATTALDKEQTVDTTAAAIATTLTTATTTTTTTTATKSTSHCTTILTEVSPNSNSSSSSSISNAQQQQQQQHQQQQI